MATFQLKLPIRKFSEFGFEHIKTPEVSINQDLKMLLLTLPGEKIDDSQYGCGILKNIFEYDSPITRRDIESVIQEQVRKYLPVVNIVSIEFLKNENILYVSLKYSIGSNVDDPQTLVLQLTNALREN